MKCERVGFIPDLPSFIVEELVFANVISRFLVYLCLEEIVLMIAVGVRATEKISCIDFLFPLGMFFSEITKNFFLHQKGSGADVPNTSQTININWAKTIHVRIRSEFRQMVRMHSLSYSAFNLLPRNILGCINQTRYGFIFRDQSHNAILKVGAIAVDLQQVREPE